MGEEGGGGLINGQNPKSVNRDKSFFLMIPKGKDCSDIIWNQRQITIWKSYLVRLQAPWIVFVYLLCFFPIQHRPCHNNVVTEEGLNLFDDCAA